MSHPHVDYPEFAYGEVLEASDMKLSEMADQLAKLGYAEDAARETTELLLLLRQTRVRAEAIQSRLAKLWAVMWKWSEFKCGEDTFKDALAGYRGEKK